MRPWSRLQPARRVLSRQRGGVLLLAALTGLTAACGAQSGTAQNAAAQHPQAAATSPRPFHLIGDGSQADTGPQPNQPVPTKLAPGQKPPQFVVFSWDGAGEDGYHLFSHFINVAQRDHATMTFFLSGIYTLPPEKRTLYLPPGHKPGASAISFLNDADIHQTIPLLAKAWEQGDDIGTHFNGHFCGAGGVGGWSVAQWHSEIDQAYSFVEHWRTNTGFKDLAPLPFDYSKELTGARTPCLEGQKNEIQAAHDYGWRYDASSPGGNQTWPTKLDGVWNFPLQLVPFAGHGNEQLLSMDYNFLANQSGGDDTKGNVADYGMWQNQAYDSFMAGFNRAYTTNRAPLFIGNHFEQWNGGIYMNAVEKVADAVCLKPDVRCISFKQMADWLDAQDPTVLRRLQDLDVGQAPNWSTISVPPAPAAPGAPGPSRPAPGGPPSQPATPPDKPAISPTAGVVARH